MRFGFRSCVLVWPLVLMIMMGVAFLFSHDLVRSRLILYGVFVCFAIQSMRLANIDATDTDTIMTCLVRRAVTLFSCLPPGIRIR